MSKSPEVMAVINANPKLQHIYELAEHPEVTAHDVELFIMGALVGTTEAELHIFLRVMSIIDANPDKSLRYSIGFAVWKYINK